MIEAALSISGREVRMDLDAFIHVKQNFQKHVHPQESGWASILPGT